MGLDHIFNTSYLRRLPGLLLFALLLGVIFWFLDSLANAIFLQQSDLAAQIFTPQPSQIWLRIFVFCVLLCFALIANHTFYRGGLIDQKRAKAELESSRAFEQSIIDGIAEPIMVIGTDYHVKLMNKAAREFSAGHGSLLNPVYCYQISHKRATPCDGIDHPCPLHQVQETDQITKVVHEHHQANGERRLVEVVAAPYWDRDGVFQGIIESMHDITDRVAAENALRQHTERLRALAMQISEVEDAERQRLARELHDQVGQNLTALGINLNIIRSQIPEDTAETIGFHLEDSMALVEQTTERIRDVMMDLRPPMLDDYGLVSALRWYGEQIAHRMKIELIVEGEEPEPRLSPAVENALFRIAQEALTNVSKHAKATQAKVSVALTPDALRLIIADNGIGFDLQDMDGAAKDQGWGLLNISERAEAVGGYCRIESKSDQGTRIFVEVPR
jgi:signal transduction histidine kinase